ncbi:hypothetical protein [Gramella sp. AN32]|uniref:Uncharacterized protein n=1 Tax=Christiangramia antarctica TaxID=2058158 RepID=A0ABW5X7A9_9FLAO|nr:hypothetical protein [Gramella sp. AN32]
MQNAEEEDEDVATILEFEDKVDDLEADDIQKMAEKYLDENYILGILMPETDEIKE